MNKLTAEHREYTKVLLDILTKLCLWTAA